MTLQMCAGLAQRTNAMRCSLLSSRNSSASGAPDMAAIHFDANIGFVLRSQPSPPLVAFFNLRQLEERRVERRRRKRR